MCFDIFIENPYILVDYQSLWVRYGNFKNVSILIDFETQKFQRVNKMTYFFQKMSDIYGPLFRKEGVAHELAKLAAFSTTDTKNLPSTSAVSTSQVSSKKIRRNRISN